LDRTNLRRPTTYQDVPKQYKSSSATNNRNNNNNSNLYSTVHRNGSNYHQPLRQTKRVDAKPMALFISPPAKFNADDDDDYRPLSDGAPLQRKKSFADAPQQKIKHRKSIISVLGPDGVWTDLPAEKSTTHLSKRNQTNTNKDEEDTWYDIPPPPPQTQTQTQNQGSFNVKGKNVGEGELPKGLFVDEQRVKKENPLFLGERLAPTPPPQRTMSRHHSYKSKNQHHHHQQQQQHRQPRDEPPSAAHVNPRDRSTERERGRERDRDDHHILNAGGESSIGKPVKVPARSQSLKGLQSGKKVGKSGLKELENKQRQNQQRMERKQAKERALGAVEVTLSKHIIRGIRLLTLLQTMFFVFCLIVTLTAATRTSPIHTSV
jgi:hypothetical protein